MLKKLAVAGTRLNIELDYLVDLVAVLAALVSQMQSSTLSCLWSIFHVWIRSPLKPSFLLCCQQGCIKFLIPPPPLGGEGEVYQVCWGRI